MADIRALFTYPNSIMDHKNTVIDKCQDPTGANWIRNIVPIQLIRSIDKSANTTEHHGTPWTT